MRLPLAPRRWPTCPSKPRSSLVPPGAGPNRQAQLPCGRVALGRRGLDWQIAGKSLGLAIQFPFPGRPGEDRDRAAQRGRNPGPQFHPRRVRVLEPHRLARRESGRFALLPCPKASAAEIEGSGLRKIENAAQAQAGRVTARRQAVGGRHPGARSKIRAGKLVSYPARPPGNLGMEDAGPGRGLNARQ